MDTSSPQRKGSSLASLLVFVALIGGYFAAQLWVLPAMGVET